MIPKRLLTILSLSTIFMSCSNENPDTLSVNTPSGGTVNYTQNVKSIIDNNCISCHGAVPANGAPMPLATYDQVKIAIQNRPLIDRISRDAGDRLLMPQGGPKLPQTAIDIIIKWQKDGLLEK